MASTYSEEEHKQASQSRYLRLVRRRSLITQPGRWSRCTQSSHESLLYLDNTDGSVSVLRHNSRGWSSDHWGVLGLIIAHS